MVINSVKILMPEKTVKSAKYDELSVKVDKNDKYLKITIIAYTGSGKSEVVWHKKIRLKKLSEKLKVKVEIDIIQGYLQIRATIV
ncbi:MAG: hypothetical protein ACQES9_10285 [Myxococcota bacterium]